MSLNECTANNLKIHWMKMIKKKLFFFSFSVCILAIFNRINNITWHLAHIHSHTHTFLMWKRKKKCRKTASQWIWMLVDSDWTWFHIICIRYNPTLHNLQYMQIYDDSFVFLFLFFCLRKIGHASYSSSSSLSCLSSFLKVK